MVASSDPQWNEGAFSNFVGLFDRVGLLTNVRKTVGIVFLPCQAAGTQLEAVYRLRMRGEGPSYREGQKGRVKCRECGEDMEGGSLAGNRMTQHWLTAEERRIWKTLATEEEPRTYSMAFPAKGGPLSCLVE